MRPARLDEAAWHTRRDVGLQLLQTLANFYPDAFCSDTVLPKLPDMLESHNDLQIDAVLKIIPLVGAGIASTFSAVAKYATRDGSSFCCS
jgi:hypothetical protein